MSQAGDDFQVNLDKISDCPSSETGTDYAKLDTVMAIDKNSSSATLQETAIERPMKLVSEIYKEFLAARRAKQLAKVCNKTLADFFSQFTDIESDSDDNTDSYDGGKPRDAMLRKLLDGDSGTSPATFEMKDRTMGQYQLQSGIEASGPSSGCQELSASSIPALTICEERVNAARRKLIIEVNVSTMNCVNVISQVSFNAPTDEDHMMNFRGQFVLQMNIFLLAMEQFSTAIAEMCHSPFLHASLLGIKVNELFGKGLDLEKVWVQYEDMRNNSLNSVTVNNVNRGFFVCCAYFHQLSFALKEYLSSLSRDYPETLKILNNIHFV